MLIVVSSYVFYGWWDYRFLILIFFSTLVDFSIGLALTNTEKTKNRKILLWTSLAINLCLLGFFKYYNFFIDNFITAFSFIGHPIGAQSLNIILPVGISFYTFQTMSYTIDIYKRKIEATKDPIAFAAFVSFFPQLVAGPIERASNLLPQFYKFRKFESSKAVDGLRQILWGLFKKVVVADTCAGYVNSIFADYTHHTGSTLIVGAVLFSFQIYGDFSGYSDIAIGTSRLFGFNLKQNFAFPYFSRDIAEFWRRWHISLSTWFRDYVYFPLGGSRVGKWLNIRNIFIIFIVSGFWHGANWTFIIWGAINAIYFLPLLLNNKNRKHLEVSSQGKFLPSLREFMMMLVTFGFVVLAWVFFRSANIYHAFHYLNLLFSKSLFTIPTIRPSILLIFIGVMMATEWFAREGKHGLENIHIYLSIFPRYLFYLFLTFCILFYQNFHGAKDFIYFQF